MLKNKLCAILTRGHSRKRWQRQITFDVRSVQREQFSPNCLLLQAAVVRKGVSEMAVGPQRRAAGHTAKEAFPANPKIGRFRRQICGDVWCAIVIKFPTKHTSSFSLALNDKFENERWGMRRCMGRLLTRLSLFLSKTNTLGRKTRLQHPSDLKTTSYSRQRADHLNKKQLPASENRNSFLNTATTIRRLRKSLTHGSP